MNIQTAVPAAIDYAAIKTRQRAVWSAGDYARIGATLQIVGETLCEAVESERQPLCARRLCWQW